jgi:hypothetical protein
MELLQYPGQYESLLQSISAILLERVFISQHKPQPPLTASSHSTKASLERGRHIPVVSLFSDTTSGSSPLSQSPYNMILRKPTWFFAIYAIVAVLYPSSMSHGLHFIAKALP